MHANPRCVSCTGLQAAPQKHHAKILRWKNRICLPLINQQTTRKPQNSASSHNLIRAHTQHPLTTAFRLPRPPRLPHLCRNPRRGRSRSSSLYRLFPSNQAPSQRSPAPSKKPKERYPPRLNKRTVRHRGNDEGKLGRIVGDAVAFVGLCVEVVAPSFAVLS